MPNTYVMHFFDTLKMLEWKTLYINLYRQCFKHGKCNWLFNLSFSKPSLSWLCYSLFKLVTWRLGKRNMGKANCEKKESFFFHTTIPCAASNLLSLWNQPNVFKPQWNAICNQFHNGWIIVQVENCYWINYYKSKMDSLC
jgi:hypothetical protein